MKSIVFLITLSYLIILGCGDENHASSEPTNHSTDPHPIHSNGNNIETRFPLPEGFQRIQCSPKEFGFFLRRLPLKPEGSLVKKFDGNSKSNPDVYAAVVDLPIGKKDLQQCADAIIRLRADYLRSLNRQMDIRFHFTNGFLAEYSKWTEGQLIKVIGNNCSWENTGIKGDADDNYWKYLEMVFNYAGTLSLSKELKSQKWEDMQIGDVLIYGGSPGHAVIVVDMAEHSITHEKIFMLAQSYMPAQEIQILYNPNVKTKTVWYSLKMDNPIVTPEWTFEKSELKKFL